MIRRFETFTFLISSINRTIHKIKSEFMEELGLKSSHVSCLYFLESEGSLTVKELAELCSDDKANLSRAATYLEEGGFVKRSTGRRGHTVRLSLTDHGHEVGARVCRAVRLLLEKTNDMLTEEERRIMYSALRKINDNLINYAPSTSDTEDSGEN